ncbi:SRPBCC family protein [Coralloluteibacterium thermophilus]|uniref:SRPBCC family protein n=1 Tax=Coralloluteibacterium thermophilum TaxID=2707049 RepID=A0ABV9NNC4_9GAMM
MRSPTFDQQASQPAGRSPAMPSTIHLHRVFRAPPERVYRAFLEPEAMTKWLPPYGFTDHVEHADVRVGGTYRMAFTNFGTGTRHAFGGEYLELVPNARIRYADRFDDAGLPGTMQVTVLLKAVAVGTDMALVQEGVPDAIPAEACHLGWQESLAQLARLVEPEIPDA